MYSQLMVTEVDTKETAIKKFNKYIFILKVNIYIFLTSIHIEF